MKIQRLDLQKIFDSRGEPTIEVRLTTAAGREFSAKVPSGKSRGCREAVVFSPEAARDSLAVVKKTLLGREFNSVAELDNFLIVLDGTENKSRLGGNVLLGVSVAAARALADEAAVPLWRLLRAEFFSTQKNLTETAPPPSLLANLINGGAHARNNLDLQEYLVIVKPAGRLIAAIEDLLLIFRRLGKRLRQELGMRNLPLGDEDGYAPDLSDNFVPLELLAAEISKMPGPERFTLGLDAAASSFFEDGKYLFGRQMIESAGLLDIYADYFRRSPLLSFVEDPFAETDFAGFKKIAECFPDKIIVGDDLTVTRPDLIKECAAQKLITGVIIKPNQVGTLSEAAGAIKTAHAAGLKTIVSHRSGETEDDLIIHLVKAGNVSGVKIGAPLNERIFKYNALLELFPD